MFSTPFIVPEVTGGSGKIFIHTWRNIRIFDNSGPKELAYFLRISQDFNEDVNTGHNTYSSATYSDGYVEWWDSIKNTGYPSPESWAQSAYPDYEEYNTKTFRRIFH